MTKIENKIDPLSALESLIRWYKDAGIESLSNEAPINHIDKIWEVRKSKATHLPSKEKKLKPQRKWEASSKKIYPSTLSQKRSLQDHGLAKSGRVVEDQLSSEAAKRAREFVKDISSIDTLHEDIDKLDLLSIQKTAAHTFLGDGDIKSKLLVMHPAPTAQDDRSGILLSGENGDLFDKMIGSIGLKREDIYMTNLVFWRPPGDRTPTQTEVAVCLPIVEQIIKIIQPQYIMAVGSMVSQALTGESLVIQKLRGKFYPFKSLIDDNSSISAQIRPIYDPQYLISSPSLKSSAWSDLLAIQNALLTSGIQK